MAKDLEAIVLSTELPDRDSFTLNEQDVQLRHREELSTKEALNLGVKLNRHVKSVNVDQEITDKQAAAIDGNLNSMLEVMLSEPPSEVFDMPRRHKELVINYFFDRYLPTTSEEPSPDSSDSTEEAPETG